MCIRDSNSGAPIYEDGYLPVITSTIHDIAVAGGLRGEAGGWNLDLSINYGSNRLDYGVENSVNVSLGGDHSPRKFNAGGMRYGQTAVNFDAQRDLDFGIGDTSLALGAEWRNENYKIVAGEPASYAVGPYFLSLIHISASLASVGAPPISPGKVRASGRRVKLCPEGVVAISVPSTAV